MKVIIKLFVWLIVIAGLVMSLVFSWKQSKISSWKISGSEIIIHEGEFRPWPAGVKRLTLTRYLPFLERMNLKEEFYRLLINKQSGIRDELSLNRTYVQYITYKYSETLSHLGEGPKAFQTAEAYLSELKRHIDNVLVKPMEDSLRERYTDFYFFKMLEAFSIKHYNGNAPEGGKDVWLKDKAFVDELRSFIDKKMPVEQKAIEVKTPEAVPAVPPVKPEKSDTPSVR